MKNGSKSGFGNAGTILAQFYNIPEYILAHLLPVCDDLEMLEGMLAVG